MDVLSLRAALIHRLVVSLGDTGKTNLQKLGYFLQEAQGVPTGYVFRMHHYGPYSEEIENETARLQVTGYLEVRPDPKGYGFHILPKSKGDRQWRTITRRYQQEVDTVLELFGGRPAWQLELAATTHYVHGLLKNAADEALIGQIKALKPRFEEEAIRQSLRDLRAAGFIS